MNSIFEKLKNSKFRSSFHLTIKDINYIEAKSMDVIKQHAFDFVCERLAPKVILNDGKQTPMRGHPVFVAMHATATCCRGCLYKWHKIEKNKELNEREIDYIVSIIITWINKEISRNFN